MKDMDLGLRLRHQEFALLEPVTSVGLNHPLGSNSSVGVLGLLVWDPIDTTGSPQGMEYPLVSSSYLWKAPLNAV